MALTTYSAPRLLRSRIPRLCVALHGKTPDELILKAETAVRDNSFLELRLDYLSNPAAALPRLGRFLKERPEATVIATCRRAVNGGKFRGSAVSQLEFLLRAADVGCHIADVEIETVDDLKRGEFEKLRRAVSTVLSFHDFRATRKLEETFARLIKVPSDFYKVVSTATCLEDNVRMIKLIENHARDYSMVGFCMGEAGLISRVLSLRAGALFTFASISAAEQTAPGQLSLRELRGTYRAESIDAATQVYGVAGDPVSHSLSPAMMNLAFRRENVNGVYLPLRAKEIEDLIGCIREIPIRGVSVTMPHKEAITAYLENADDLVKKTGACNTVVRGQDGKLYGFNTDVAGIVGPLGDRVNLQGARVLVLGAGGAARAAVFGLASRGATVFICNRTLPKAQKLARQAGAKLAKRSELKKLDFDAIINATPIGMGLSKQSPLQEDELRTRVVFDMVYNPVETRLLKMARSKGIAVLSGAEMFVRQGARQFEIWSGKPAPIDEMRGVVLKALEERRLSEAPETAPQAPKAAPPAVPASRVGRQKAIKATPPSNGNRRAVKPALKKAATKKSKGTVKAR